MGKLRSDHIYEMNINTVNVDDMASVTVYESKYINQLKALAEKHPDEIKIIPTGLAGVVLAHLPKKYVHVSFYESSKREMSEEQKVAAAERLKKAREKKAESNE
jgi:hypothetical protein